MKEFAICLKEARMREGLTQKELADELKVSLKTYKGWESHGKNNRTPSLEMLTKIADTLKITLDELVGR